MRATLALVDGTASPDVVDLAPDRPISIGRSRDNTVVLPHEEQASRLHARVYYERGRWLLRDFGLNGTKVGNARVNQVAELADGTEIRIGAVRFRFRLPAPASPPTTADRSAASETMALSAPGPRWTADELTALNQVMATAVEARETGDLARGLVQAVFYQTGATACGLFSLDPSDPVPKYVWPESARPDEAQARQLTRRVHRDHRTVWLAEDTAVTQSRLSGPAADALAVPLKAGGKVLGALHLYKTSGYFSDRDKRFAEAVAGFAAPVVGGLRERRALEAEVGRLRAAVPDGDELLGDSRPMVSLRLELARAAAGTKPILLRGEAGVGKKLAAREAHRRGPRADGPLVVVRCSTTPAAVLEAELFGYRRGAFSGADREFSGSVAEADEGTLFVDEVGDLPDGCQVRLLRLIERGTYRPLGATLDSRSDVWVMAGTRKDLHAEVQAGRFRADLLTALRGSEVIVPPLRTHADDIPLLAQFFLGRMGAEWEREWTLAPEAVDRLRDQPWPGNVRQLRGVLAAAATSAPADTITPDDVRAGFTRD